MLTLLLLATAYSVGTSPPSLPCVPIASDALAPTTSAIDEHRAFRKALNEPMPQAPTMVMLHGKGGHHATDEYSVILARGTDDVWRGTAVGRSQIWMEGAQYEPMKRIEWVLDTEKARQLDDAISRRCPFDRSAAKADLSEPPPLGFISERIDLISPGHLPVTYYGSEGNGAIASMIRPPKAQ